MIKIERVVRPKENRSKEHLRNAIIGTTPFFLTQIFWPINPFADESLLLFNLIFLPWTFYFLWLLNETISYFFLKFSITWQDGNFKEPVPEEKIVEKVKIVEKLVEVEKKVEVIKEAPRWEKLSALPENVEYLLIGNPPRNLFLSERLLALVKLSNVDLPIIGRNPETMDVRVILINSEEMTIDNDEGRISLGEIVIRSEDKLIFTGRNVNKEE